MYRNKDNILLSSSTHIEGLLTQLIRPGHETRSQVVSRDAFETHENARSKQLLVLAVLLRSVHPRLMLIPDVNRVLDNLSGGQTVENRLSASPRNTLYWESLCIRKLNCLTKRRTKLKINP